MNKAWHKVFIVKFTVSVENDSMTILSHSTQCGMPLKMISDICLSSHRSWWSTLATIISWSQHPAPASAVTSLQAISRMWHAANCHVKKHNRYYWHIVLLYEFLFFVTLRYSDWTKCNTWISLGSEIARLHLKYTSVLWAQLLELFFLLSFCFIYEMS